MKKAYVRAVEADGSLAGERRGCFDTVQHSALVPVQLYTSAKPAVIWHSIWSTFEEEYEQPYVDF